jgi:hypothetical protein
MAKFKNVANQDIRIYLPQGRVLIMKDDIIELPEGASKYPRFLMELDDEGKPKSDKQLQKEATEREARAKVELEAHTKAKKEAESKAKKEAKVKAKAEAEVSEQAVEELKADENTPQGIESIIPTDE